MPENAVVAVPVTAAFLSGIWKKQAVARRAAAGLEVAMRQQATDAGSVGGL